MKINTVMRKTLSTTAVLLAIAVLCVQPLTAKTHGRHKVARPSGNVVETAIAAGQFKTLAAALEAAGLVDALTGAGPFTVFAPTDAAFAKLPAGTVESLLKPENKEKLKSILLYHVVSGNVMAKQVMKMNGQKVKTLEGGSVKVNTKHGVMIDNARVTTADIAASNGVIHVIDTVLMPKM